MIRVLGALFHRDWDEALRLIPSSIYINHSDKALCHGYNALQWILGEADNTKEVLVLKALLDHPDIDTTVRRDGDSLLEYSNEYDRTPEFHKMLLDYEEINFGQPLHNMLQSNEREDKVTPAWTPDVPKPGIFDQGFKL